MKNIKKNAAEVTRLKKIFYSVNCAFRKSTKQVMFFNYLRHFHFFRLSFLVTLSILPLRPLPSLLFIPFLHIHQLFSLFFYHLFPPSLHRLSPSLLLSSPFSHPSSLHHRLSSHHSSFFFFFSPSCLFLFTKNPPSF